LKTRWIRVEAGTASLGYVSTIIAATAALVLAVGPPAPVGPNQFFVGVVNDASVDAQVFVTCDASGTTGHPRAGQTVAVLPASGTGTAQAGFTGTAGKEIAVGVGAGTGTQAVLRLRLYQVREQIPTSLLVPCTGSGLVSFLPAPASDTSRPATVKVTFVRDQA
jgi:hypothetical protein